MRQPPDATPGPAPYYVALDKGHDDLLRCAECHRLLTYATLERRGATPCCGTRRVLEVQALSFWEWLRIRVGFLRFAHRAAFLKEFRRG